MHRPRRLPSACCETDRRGGLSEAGVQTKDSGAAAIMGSNRSESFSRAVGIICLLTFCLVFACRSSGDGIESRIDAITRVETGLVRDPGPATWGCGGRETDLTGRMRFYEVPGVSLAVINDYRIEWARGYGVKRSGQADPVTPQTLFQAGSISKPVAAIVALRLVERGLIELDEDINRKLVSWKVPENEFTTDKKVTLRAILSHSAGCTVHGFTGYARGEKIPGLLQILEGKKPANSAPVRVRFEPGSKWRYCGGGYAVMQQLLMDLTKKSFPRIASELVFEPMGMKSSTYQQTLAGDAPRRAAVAHGENGKPFKGKWHIYPEMAAAGLWTTPTDLGRLAIEIMLARAGKSRRLLSPDMARKLLTRQSGDWGLGFQLGGHEKDLHFSHGGLNKGFTAHLIAYPERGQGAVVMTNTDQGGELIQEVLRSIAREYGWAISSGIVPGLPGSVSTSFKRVRGGRGFDR